MINWIGNGTIWAAIAAAGSLLTAVVIAVNSIFDRRQQRELAVRTIVKPDEATVTNVGCRIPIRNHGPATARDVVVRVRIPTAAGHVTETQGPITSKVALDVLPVLSKAEARFEWPQMDELGLKHVGVDLEWYEETGKRRELKMDTPVGSTQRSRRRLP